MIKIGTKIDKLTVIEDVGKVKGVYSYKCECICGKICIVRRYNLKNNISGSCGCNRKLTCKANSLISAEKRWLGGNEAAKRMVLSYYKANAKRHGREFKLSNDFFYNIIQKNCYYCNQVPNTIQKVYRSKVDKIYETYTYNGIDRIDSSIGYIENNCVPCCIKCNIMKMDNSQKEFINHVRKIINYMDSK